MARITSLDIEVARDLIKAKDLEGICDWYDLHNPCVDKDQFRSVFYGLFKFDDTSRALKYFNSLELEGTNPTTQCITNAIVGSVGCFVFVLMLLGCFGGIVFLFTLF